MKKDRAVSTRSSDVKLHELAKADLRFGFNLFAAIASSQAQKSLFVSPASVAIVLAMVYNAARGETQKAMAKTLELKDLSLDEINRANAALQESLQGFDPQVWLTIANSLWGNEDIHFNPEFIQNNEQKPQQLQPSSCCGACL